MSWTFSPKNILGDRFEWDVTGRESDLLAWAIGRGNPPPVIGPSLVLLGGPSQGRHGPIPEGPAAVLNGGYGDGCLFGWKKGWLLSNRRLERG